MHQYVSCHVRGFLLVYVCMPGISGSMFINVDNCRVGGKSGGRGRSRVEATSGVLGIVYTSAPREKAGRRESVCPMTGDWERERAGGAPPLGDFNCVFPSSTKVQEECWRASMVCMRHCSLVRTLTCACILACAQPFRH
jgi:hypothetical protein